MCHGAKILVLNYLNYLGNPLFFLSTRLKSSFSSSNTDCNASGTCTDIHSNKGDDMSLAVVCIDPSSMRSGGSILGDKTRMEQLSRHNRAFVRPSPNRGTLGGIASYTNDVVAICQLAGYPLVIVETVGLGQSEVDIDNTVDMSILLLAPGGGDSLQGVKKVMQLVRNCSFTKKKLITFILFTCHFSFSESIKCETKNNRALSKLPT